MIRRNFLVRFQFTSSLSKIVSKKVERQCLPSATEEVGCKAQGGGSLGYLVHARRLAEQRLVSKALQAVLKQSASLKNRSNGRQRTPSQDGCPKLLTNFDRSDCGCMHTLCGCSTGSNSKNSNRGRRIISTLFQSCGQSSHLCFRYFKFNQFVQFFYFTKPLR